MIRHLICGNNYNWLLNLYLIDETLQSGAGSEQSHNTGAIDVKMDGSALEENSLFKMLGFAFSSKLDQGS